MATATQTHPIDLDEITTHTHDITAIQTVIYDDVLCDDSTIYYGDEDFYALILEEIVKIAAMFP